jgi:hypothetical protein
MMTMKVTWCALVRLSSRSLTTANLLKGLDLALEDLGIPISPY